VDESRTVREGLARAYAKGWQDGCNAGLERHCSFVAVQTDFIGETAEAFDRYRAACKMGDPWACDLLKHRSQDP
jgi:hypothetical protein